MVYDLLCAINTTSAVLLGALIGGIIGVIGTLITTWASFRTQRQTFRRNFSQQQIKDIQSAYEFIMKVIYESRRSGSFSPLYGEMIGKIVIFASREFNQNFMKLLVEGIPNDFEIQSIMNSMQQHIKELQDQIP